MIPTVCSRHLELFDALTPKLGTKAHNAPNISFGSLHNDWNLASADIHISLPEGYGSFTCHNDFCDLKYLLDQVNILFICCNQPLFTARNFKKPT